VGGGFRPGGRRQGNVPAPWAQVWAVVVMVAMAGVIIPLARTRTSPIRTRGAWRRRRWKAGVEGGASAFA